ncbi:hypothetical protein H310_08636 [Aphanomyces invadans]|uniref:Uncharacterized protein n=1 Tax=Aphanomyces invadans TaxID=157072 RepID=A0A024TWW1_9STRA|nr:hypothetical protein H310_08636 [Aphanomyces invadans]ETV98498.1 hypothetical protein H310_08636 [Aphanomyces invadans]|eukprot:XP_008872695.1 hypothetical protein H310_08636 [Aphanomyces invadans]
MLQMLSRADRLCRRVRQWHTCTRCVGTFHGEKYNTHPMRPRRIHDAIFACHCGNKLAAYPCGWGHGLVWGVTFSSVFEQWGMAFATTLRLIMKLFDWAIKTA